MLELRSGNLLEATTEALVNAVNTEGVMGKGIALQFKQRFPKMFDVYYAACAAGELQVGRMHVFDRGADFSPRYIINFPTKRSWREPSRMDDVEAGLTALANEIQHRSIRSIAIPALGCGNGGLRWSEVYPRIVSTLGNIKEVQVIVYEPSAKYEFRR